MTGFTGDSVMFSKIFSTACRKKIMLALISVMALSACSWLGHKTPPVPASPDTGLGDTACLSAVPRTMANFAAAKAPDAEIAATFDCMSAAVSNFERSTQGRFEDRFTSKELTNFVSQYFLPNTTCAPPTRSPSAH